MAVIEVTSYYDPQTTPRMSLFMRLDPHRRSGTTRIQWVWAHRLSTRWRRSIN